MIERGRMSHKLLAFLALDRHAAHLCQLRAPADVLSPTRFCGSLSLILVILLFASGGCMMFYYSPTPGSAYDSVDYAQFSLPFGDVVRGVHFYAWNLLLAVVTAHMAGTFLTGAYKAPGQLTWVSGVLALLVVPLLIVTGDLLPWDQKGYWTTQVRNSIIAVTPGVGDFLTRLLQGGPRTGAVALTRFYVLHCVFLPCALVAFVASHFHFLFHRGLAEPLEGQKAVGDTIPVYPDLIVRWLALFIVVTVLLGLAAWQWPAPLERPADPTDSTYVPAPEWWVLAFNQLVGIFRGPFMFIGASAIPGGLALLLLTLPFLDRSPERRPSRRRCAILIASLLTAIFFGLSFLGWLEHFGPGAH